MHPPVFRFSPVAGAAGYRCTLSGQDGQGGGTRQVRSSTPAVDLAAIWADLPAAGRFGVLAEALDAQGNPLGQIQYTFSKIAPFQGPYRPAKSDYLESGARAARWVCDKARDGKANQFPTLFAWCYNEALLTYARLRRDADGARALAQARENGRALIAAATPADWTYAHMPPSHADRKVLQVPRCGMAGMAFLDLYAQTSDKTFLDAAVRVGEGLRKTQAPDGCWPFRVDPQTGKVLMDHTSDQVEAIVLLDELSRSHAQKQLEPARDKALAWVLANPCRTYQWQQQYEDVGTLPPYRNLEWFDVAWLIPYLLRNATPQNGHDDLALELFRYIEDQFVDWEPSGNYITPGVREQYVCHHVIDAHVGLYIRVCLEMHARKKDELFLKKARAMADTLTAVQHPDGYYPTWMNHKPAKENPGELREINYGSHWANCTAIAGANLMRLGEYLQRWDR